jgi:hypothetical protein
MLPFSLSNDSRINHNKMKTAWRPTWCSSFVSPRAHETLEQWHPEQEEVRQEHLFSLIVQPLPKGYKS